jgi:hypothetical protein
MSDSTDFGQSGHATAGNSYSAKKDSEFVENLQPTSTRATYISPEAAAGLSPEHQEYLLQRHGTFELDPIPGFGQADPYNWPQWKVSGFVKL